MATSQNPQNPPPNVLNRSYPCGRCGVDIPVGTPLDVLWYDKNLHRPDGQLGVWVHQSCPLKQSAPPSQPAYQEPPPPTEASPFKTGAQVLAERQAVVAQPTSAPLASPQGATFGDMTEEQVRLLKSIGKFPQDASPDEVKFGLSVAKRLNLDPFRRQIRFVRFSSQEPIEPFVTIDGLQAVAARTGQLAGIDPPLFEQGEDPAGPPISASVAVYRLIHGQRFPFIAIVRWSEFVRRNREGKVNRTWSEMPFHMLGKVARSHALRMAFPEDLSGLYEEGEAPE